MTRLNVLEEDPVSTEMRSLWQQVEEDDLIKYIFAKQATDGSWYTGGPWHPASTYIQKEGYTPVSPKYVTTVWVLGILGEMGYTASDPRVMKAVDYTLGWQLVNGVITEDRRELGKVHDEDPPNYPCRMSIILAYLTRVGAASDPRLKKSLDLLVRWQREDGGWLSEGHRDGSFRQQGWNRSCPWVSHFAVRALYNSHLPSYHAALEKGLLFLAKHLDMKPVDEIKRIFYHGHEPLRDLEMFADFKIAIESRSTLALVEWLNSMRDPKTGRYRYNGIPLNKVSAKIDKVSPSVMRFRAFHQAEDDWLTYKAVKIMRNL